MTPKTITLADDVREQLEQKLEAEGGTLDDLANETLRTGLGAGTKWRLRVSARDYKREIAEAPSDEEAIQIAVDAVHESRTERAR